MKIFWQRLTTELRIMQRIACVLILLGGTFFASIASAHHSHAMLDPNDVRVLSGIVTRYSWSMPHVYLTVQAPNPAGTVVEYSIEMLHPAAMAEQGWSKTSSKPGDRITWEGEHDKNKARAYSSLNWAENNGTRIGGIQRSEKALQASTAIIPPAPLANWGIPWAGSRTET